MHKRVLLSLLGLPVAILAQPPTSDDFNDRLTALEKKVDDKTLYNAPANSRVRHNYNLFITGDFLYWKANENGLTYGILTDNPAGIHYENHLKLKDPHFRWDYGFRAGMGMNFPHDHWDLYVNWTHFYTGAHGHAHAKHGQAIFPVWEYPNMPGGGQFVEEANAHWKLYLNILDAELGKEYYVGKKLSVRPHLDLRNLWITQRYNINYGPGDSDTDTDTDTDTFTDTDTDSDRSEDRVKLKNSSWGIGPRVGLDLQFSLFWGLSLSGNADVSLIYGRFTIREKESMEDVSGHTSSHQTLHMTRAITDLGIYLGWDRMLFHDNFHFGIKGGWEQHLFFEQNQFYRFVDPTFQGAIVSNQGDLALQGWTLNARIDF